MQKRSIFLVGILSFLGYLFPLHASAFQNYNFIASGYGVTKDQSLPLLATSQNGIQWDYSPDITSLSKLPWNYKDDGYLSATECSSAFCVAAGTYDSNENEEIPLLVTSLDKGNVWSYIPTKPNDYYRGLGMWGPLSLSCSHQFCAIGGGYLNFSHQWLPFLAVSKDGKAWYYPQSLVEQLPKDPYNVLKIINCPIGDDFCIATGETGKGSRDNSPFIAISTHQAETWTIAALPKDLYKHSILFDVKCKGNFCVAVGVSNLQKQTLIEKHLILLSKDKGKTWSSVKNIPPDLRGVFELVSFSGNACIVMGYSTTQDEKYLPFVALTNDEGATWSYPQSIVTSLPKELLDYKGNDIRSIFCNENVCIAVGYGWGYNKKTRPLIAVSRDRGFNWLYAKIDNLPLGGVNKAAELNKVTCIDKLCIASGEYRISDTVYFPYLIVSEDEGKTWTMPPSIQSMLPENILRGEFFSHSSFSVSDNQRKYEAHYTKNII